MIIRPNQHSFSSLLTAVYQMQTQQIYHHSKAFRKMIVNDSKQARGQGEKLFLRCIDTIILVQMIIGSVFQCIQIYLNSMGNCNSHHHILQALQNESLFTHLTAPSPDPSHQYRQLIHKIAKELSANHQLYGQFIDLQIIKNILTLHQRMFIDSLEATQVVEIALDFMGYVINQSQPSAQINTCLTNQYGKQIGIKFQKVRNPAYQFNKGHLRILSFIVPQPKSNKLHYGLCFQKLEFKLEKQEYEQVAAVVKRMCQKNLSAFCFLSNYFIRSIRCLEDHDVPVYQIKQKYLDALTRLSQTHKPAPKIYHHDKEVFKKHKNRIFKERLPKFELNLAHLASIQERKKALEDFIMERAAQSASHFQDFSQMVRSICEENDGYHIKVGLKIRDRSQAKALERIKQKMLAKSFLQKIMKRSKHSLLKGSQGYDAEVKHQKMRLRQKMEEVISQFEKPIAFQVTDMLRAKSMFSQVSKINKCCSQILKLVEADDYIQLIEVDNRLSKKNSDLVLKLLYGNVVAQIQLVINLSFAEYEFSHKLYELERSKFYSQMTQLSVLNQKLTDQYCNEANEVIRVNTKTPTPIEYGEDVTFLEVSKFWPGFLSMVEYSRNEKEIFIDTSLMTNQMSRLEQIINCEKGHLSMKSESFKIRKKGNYFLEMKKYEEAKQCFLRCLQLNKPPDLQNSEEIALALNNLGDTYNWLQDYAKAIDSYQKCLDIQNRINGKGSLEVAVTTNSLGKVYKSKGNYPKALECYQKCLDIYQKKKGVENAETAQIFNNMGVVYKDQGNYNKATEYYLRCLKIRQSLKGKTSIETAQSINNLGVVYKHQGNYPRAIEFLQKSKSIKQRSKGKGCLESARTLDSLGSVEYGRGNYPKSIEYYEAALEIYDRIKGKDSIDSTETLNHLGVVYKSRGQYIKAIQLYERALHIQQSVRSEKNILTAETFSNFGVVFDAQHNYDRALEYHQRCLQTQQRIKGKGCIDTGESFNNLGVVYMHQKNYSKAIDCFNRSIQIKERIKGNQCLEVASSLDNLGKVFESKLQYLKALEYYSKALQIKEKIKGKGSIDTAETLNNMGKVHLNCNERAKAIDLYETALQIQERVKGIGNIDSAYTMSLIAEVHVLGADYGKAIELYQKSVGIFERILGSNSWALKRAFSGLNKCYKAIGDHGQAQYYKQEVNSIYRSGKRN